MSTAHPCTGGGGVVAGRSSTRYSHPERNLTRRYGVLEVSFGRGVSERTSVSPYSSLLSPISDPLRDSLGSVSHDGCGGGVSGTSSLWCPSLDSTPTSTRLDLTLILTFDFGSLDFWIFVLFVLFVGGVRPQRGADEKNGGLPEPNLEPRTSSTAICCTFTSRNVSTRNILQIL
jgi:hypothetical protein